jgi:hypothetical protein
VETSKRKYKEYQGRRSRYFEEESTKFHQVWVSTRKSSRRSLPRSVADSKETRSANPAIPTDSLRWPTIYWRSFTSAALQRLPYKSTLPDGKIPVKRRTNWRSRDPSTPPAVSYEPAHSVQSLWMVPIKTRLDRGQAGIIANAERHLRPVCDSA